MFFYFQHRWIQRRSLYRATSLYRAVGPDLDRASFPSDAGTEIAQCKTLANTNLTRWKPEIYLWMTASIIGCLGLKSVNYERLHSFWWDFHNWMKLSERLCRSPSTKQLSQDPSVVNFIKKNVFLSQKLNVWHQNYKIATILPTHVIQYGLWLHLHVKMYKIGIMTNSWVH